MAEKPPNPESEDLLQRLLALPPAERGTFLNAVLLGDEVLRQRIEEHLTPAEQGTTLSDGDSRLRASPEAPGPTARHRSPPDPQSSAHGRFVPGTVIAQRYRIVSLAGRGGMGEVYRADDLKLGQVVALKFLPREVAGDPNRQQRFIDEVRLSRQLAHPNVCRVYDIQEMDGHPFLSMEYIDGEDLQSLLRRIGRLPSEKAAHLAQQLCAGLAAAHEKGVLHRDLKPANIMIDGRGHARITDFGLARLADGSSPDGRIAGTVPYMAPEQLSRGEATVQSDLYALGLVFYEMFTGQRVHSGDSIQERIRRDSETTIKPPSTLVADMDPSIEQVILRCLEPERTRRPSSARAVAAGLPGGDPLAAAVAAGETPSPEMVAAAGGEGTLRPWVAGICLLAVGFALVLAPPIAQRTYLLNRADLNEHPQVLASKARDLIKRFGYTNEPVDSAFGFIQDEAHDLRFWYRQRPTILTVGDFWGSPPNLSYGTVSDFNPRWDTPGEIGLHLAPDGRLLKFRAVPRPSHGPWPPPSSDWREWFTPDVIGFDLADLEPVENRRIPPPHALDALRLWRSDSPLDSQGLFVQAAAYEGRPVFFHTMDRRTFEEELQSAEINPRSRYQSDVLFTSVHLLVWLTAAIFALRNVHSGRWDRRGTARVAVFVFASTLLISALQANVTVSTVPAMLDLALAHASLVTLQVGVYYLALEPYVRRLWPTVLIAWARLTGGRFSDPLVGRDLLVGSALGCGFWLIIQLKVLCALSLDPAAIPRGAGHEWQTLDLATTLAHWVETPVNVLTIAFYFLMFLLVCRLLLRRMLLVTLLSIALWTPVMVLDHPESLIALDLSTWPALIALSVWIMVRLGLLAWVVCFFCRELLLSSPITSDFSAWYAGCGLSGMLLVALLAALGFWTSTGRRLPFGSNSGARTR